MSREHTYIWRSGAVSCVFVFDPHEKLSAAARKRSVATMKKHLTAHYWRVPKRERDQFCRWGAQLIILAEGFKQAVDSGFDI